ncbi:MAG: ExeM/NucH family extracellular endonuclease [Rhodanobacteraceae bacterium]|nr:ExeM/NucH family extracellular endonuclease [Rhodanobacteraceae bacterium]
MISFHFVGSPFVRAARRGSAVLGRAALVALLASAAMPAMAQVSLTALDVSYTQNFDTLPSSGSATWSDNSTIAGWYAVRTGSGTTIVADTGAGTGGNLYSYGASGNSDRAIGSLGSGNAAAGSFFWGVRLQNNTGSPINSLDVAYTGEQWRNGAAAAQTIAFSYLVGTPAVTGALAEFQASGVSVTALDFTSPITGGTAGPLNGNLAANRTVKTFTITGLDIPVGAEVMLRWSDPDHPGTDHGLSIDDFSVTPHTDAALPGLSIDDVSHEEGNSGTTAFTFTVNLDAPAPAGGVQFDIATADGSATAPSDYAAKSLTGQTIPAGSSSYTFTVLVNGDTLPEPDETFLVNVANVNGARVVRAQGTGTIVNDDAAPKLSIADVAQSEGNSGTTAFTFTVSLDVPAPPGGVSFDIATADSSATAPSDYAAKSLTGQVIPAGTSSYTFDVLVNGDTTVEPDETFFVNVTNVDGAIVVKGQGTGMILNDDMLKIHDVQGSGATTPIAAGALVAVEGVVTASYQGSGKLSGFFLQEEDTDADADPATSEGIFVFCSACPVAVTEGQRVRVTGTVTEYFGMTQINATTAAAVVVTDTGNHLNEVTPTPVALPIAGDVDAFYEAREGMLVTYSDTLTVSEYFELARYGQILLVQGERPRQYTADNTPSASGYAAHLDAIARRQVILDDENNTQNWPLTLTDGSQYAYHPHANGGFGVGTQGVDFFRGGDQVHDLTGVLHWSFAGLSGTDAWRIRPTTTRPVTFTVANPRPTQVPQVGGAIKAVSMNLLNYFTTIDTTSSSSSGPCGPTGGQDCRGADNPAELARQRERASLVLCSLNPDVAGLMELENTTPTDTINDLLGAVNARCGGTHPYTFVNTGGTLGSDAIRVMLIYRTGVLGTVGTAKVDMDSVHSRPPTAQTFEVVDATNVAFGKRFTVVANHFKSKGCGSATGADLDQNDGQGCYSSKRTAQANRLLTWLNGTVIPAAGNADVLLLGDFNAYAKEPPVVALTGGGYVDLETSLLGPAAYSYLFDGQLGHLDYAFASASLAGKVTGIGAWHINADEVPLFDYNDEIRDVGEAAQEEKPDGSNLMPPRVVYESGTPYRASDHDPVLVGLFDSTDLAVTVTASPDPVTAGTNLTYTITASNNGPVAASAASWTDTLPPGMSFVSLSNAAGWTCTTPAVGAGGTITCDAATFAVGNAAFTLTVAVAPSVAAGTVLGNVVKVSSALSDPTPANNSAIAMTTVAASADLSLTLGGTPNPVTAGTNLTYALTVANAGPSNAASATLTDTLPSGTTFVSLASAAGWSCNTPAVGATGTVTCTHAEAPTGNAAFTLVVKVDSGVAGGSVLTNSASVSATTTDPVPANNSANVTTNVLAAPQGNLTITPTSLAFGNQVLGTTSAPASVTLANSGTAALDVTALTVANAPFARVGGTCTTTLPITLAAGANCTLSYAFTPSATGPASQTLTVTANTPGSGTIALSGMGTVPQADVAVTITDGREFVQVGETLNYVITVSNAGPDAATATVGDALPAELGDGAWTCVPTGAATCANGSGNVLSDVAVLPAGTQATYVYSATVQAGHANERIVNAASASVAAPVVDLNPANNSASDTPATVVVVFRDGFESAGVTRALDGFADQAGFVSAQLVVDRALLGTLGSMPVGVARGETADGRTAFTLELARFNSQYVMRLTTRDVQGGSARSEWRAVELAAGPLDFAWQSAAAGQQDGYLRLALGSAVLQSSARADSARLVRLHIAVRDELPWLTLAPN